MRCVRTHSCKAERKPKCACTLRSYEAQEHEQVCKFGLSGLVKRRPNWRAHGKRPCFAKRQDYVLRTVLLCYSSNGRWIKAFSFSAVYN
jgi:hypothetical protein